MTKDAHPGGGATSTDASYVTDLRKAAEVAEQAFRDNRFEGRDLIRKVEEKIAEDKMHGLEKLQQLKVASLTARTAKVPTRSVPTVKP